MVRSARKQPPPIAVGKTVDARVEALPFGPDAIARADGYVLFVPGAIPGEDVRVRVTEATRRFGRAEIQRVLARSPDRAEPFCPHFLHCGGCHLQHLLPDARRRAKRSLLARALEHALGREVPVGELEALPERGYREKVALVLAPGGPGGIKAGFYRTHSHEIVPISTCPVQEDRATELAFATVDALRTVGARAFDEDRLTGDVRHVVVRAGAGTGELFLIIVLARPGRPAWTDELLGLLRALDPKPIGIAFNVSPRRERDLVLGDETHVLHGPERYRTTVDGITYLVSPHSFFQTSSAGAAAVVRAVAHLLGPIKGKRVFDVYGGAGLIGLALAKRGARVIIIEGNPASIADARATSESSGITIASRRGRAEDVIPRLAQQGTRAHACVLDPPRDGCHPRLLETLAREGGPEKIVYVSCEPTTLARDLASLEERGFVTRAVVPVDMFPHTFHVEAVALLERGARP